MIISTTLDLKFIESKSPSNENLKIQIFIYHAYDMTEGIHISPN